MNYEDLLRRAQKSVSQVGVEDRFTLPTAELMIEGSKTIIKNFSDIADTLRRDQDHIFKFFLKALAVPGEIKGNRASFTGSFTQRQMDNRIREYARLFVICYSCGKPDTHIKKYDGQEKLKCEACGSKTKLRA